MPAAFSDAKGAAGGTQTDCQPDTIELPVQQADGRFAVRLGDLMKEVKRVVWRTFTWVSCQGRTSNRNSASPLR